MTTTFVVEHADQLHGRRDSSDEQTGLDAYVRTRQRLSTGGIALRRDEEARALYLELHQQWSGAGQGLLHHFGYRRHLDV